VFTVGQITFGDSGIEGHSLLGRLEADNSLDTRENAAEVLAAIARSRASPLTRVLGSRELLKTLVDKAFEAPQGNTLVQVCAPCQGALLRE
jgi:hypothetical protein